MSGAGEERVTLHSNKKKSAGLRLRFAIKRFNASTYYTLYVLLLVVPPRPVQFVWKNSPRGLSTRSYVWAPK